MIAAIWSAWARENAALPAVLLAATFLAISSADVADVEVCLDVSSSGLSELASTRRLMGQVASWTARPAARLVLLELSRPAAVCRRLLQTDLGAQAD